MEKSQLMLQELMLMINYDLNQYSDQTLEDIQVLLESYLDQVSTLINARKMRDSSNG